MYARIFRSPPVDSGCPAAVSALSDAVDLKPAACGRARRDSQVVGNIRRDEVRLGGPKSNEPNADLVR